MLEEALERARGFLGSIDFDLWMNRIAKGLLILVGTGVAGAIVYVSIVYGPAIFASAGACEAGVAAATGGAMTVATN